MTRIWRICGRFIACMVLAAGVGVLSGCGAARDVEPVRLDGVADLQRLPQNAAAYLPPKATEPLVSLEAQQEMYTRFLQRFFAPWLATGPSFTAADAFWGTSVFGARTGYAENLQPWSLARWEALVAMQRSDAYPSLSRRAIVTRNASFRVMPTDKPFFYNPSNAGEGYPFDYMQNSAVWIGTPVLVTHVSADGAWYFAEAGHVSGWLPADAFGWADEAFCIAYRNGAYAAVVRDGTLLRTREGAFAGVAHIGAVFPLVPAAEAVPGTESGGQQLSGGIDSTGSSPEGTTREGMADASGVVAAPLTVFVPARDVAGNAVMVLAELSASAAGRLPLRLTAQAVATIANGMMGQLYGWGGMLENRDCSAAMRDMLTVFGVWLPRNSAQQGRRGGTLVSLEGMTVAGKRDIILEQGIPFYSLIWFRGHIGLYLGQDAQTGEPLLLHSVWGARTQWEGREGRAVVGRTVITTVRFAEERSDVSRDWFYDRMMGLVVLPFGGQRR
ncbi:SH3 domain-containing protein [Desulfovibrio psychrotolerans]|uniref:Hydrolase Nlp/P60 n=1 Tax=Desulfovibrio psychrotolerans TaxID=415242 RepID=A0A7J0BSD0_9BACT|nr:NlpC/P60 family N-terminal domain-containing protein [Desulfovibrio psychrotolerans]GFM36623.1 hydrolase Nlp/P60 [Desulfovibrio psychrotolerans]